MWIPPEALKRGTLYIAVDPSFKGFGCATYSNGNLSVFQVDTKESVVDPVKLLANSMELNLKVWGELSYKLALSDHVVMLIETPPPRGMFTAGLNFLVGSFTTFVIHQRSQAVIYGTSAMTIKSIHGSRKATKGDSIMLAKTLFDGEFVEDSLTHNEADALILLEYLFHTVLGLEDVKNAESAQKFSRPKFSRLI